MMASEIRPHTTLVSSLQHFVRPIAIFRGGLVMRVGFAYVAYRRTNLPVFILKERLTPRTINISFPTQSSAH